MTACGLPRLSPAGRRDEQVSHASVNECLALRKFASAASDVAAFDGVAALLNSFFQLPITGLDN